MKQEEIGVQAQKDTVPEVAVWEEQVINGVRVQVLDLREQSEAWWDMLNSMSEKPEEKKDEKNKRNNCRNRYNN